MKTIKMNTFKTVKLLSLVLVLFISSCADENTKNTTKDDIASKVEAPQQDIHEAILTNNYDVFNQHLKAGRDINKKEAMGGSTPLMTAITFDKPEMVKALLKADVDLSVQNNDGSTALHTAAFFGKTEIVQQLIDANADKSIKNNFGATARESVLGDFAQMKPVYEMMILQLQPMGFQLDLNEVEKARPVIALMLQ
ncbi:MAG: hypothetical protein Wins2KO_26830 [Winogradskyella sp.]